jgi:hypothetical protein
LMISTGGSFDVVKNTHIYQEALSTIKRYDEKPSQDVTTRGPEC